MAFTNVVLADLDPNFSKSNRSNVYISKTVRANVNMYTMINISEMVNAGA